MRLVRLLPCEQQDDAVVYHQDKTKAEEKVMLIWAWVKTAERGEVVAL